MQKAAVCRQTTAQAFPRRNPRRLPRQAGALLRRPRTPAKAPPPSSHAARRHTGRTGAASSQRLGAAVAGFQPVRLKGKQGSRNAIRINHDLHLQDGLSLLPAAKRERQAPDRVSRPASWNRQPTRGSPPAPAIYACADTNQATTKSLGLPRCKKGC